MKEGVLPPPGKISSLESISPTRYVSFQACALRTVWASGRVKTLLPFSPSARLGSVIHKLLEDAGRGTFQPGDADAVGARWAELIEAAEDEMRGSWLERHLVPIRQSVPDFEVRRIQTRERALEIAASAARHPARGTTQAQGPYGCEIRVSTPDGSVVGIIDVAVPSESGPILRDYKSGAIFESQVGHEETLKSAYETQLRMYAALYACTYGTWPVRLEVVPILGTAHIVQFEREHCLKLVEEARSVLKDVNDKINDLHDTPGPLQNLLASPSPSVCRQCPFRPWCSPYQAARALVSDTAWPFDLWGQLEGLAELGNSRLLVTILSSDHQVRVRGVTPGVRHPALSELRPGDFMAIFNIRTTGSDFTFAEGPLTAMYRLLQEE